MTEYLQLSDKGLSSEFDQVLTGSALDSAIAAGKVMQQLDLTQAGETSFDSFENISEGKYSFCLDVSKTTLFDSSGADLTPADRPLRVPMSMIVEQLPKGKKISQLDIRRFARC